MNKKKNKTKVQKVTDLIDDIISPDNMGQEEAIDFLIEIADFCNGIAEGIQNDIERGH